MKLLLVLAPLVVTRADFVLVDWATDWYTARDYCRDNYYDLASIHSADDNEAVRAACAGTLGGLRTADHEGTVVSCSFSINDHISNHLFA